MTGSNVVPFPDRRTRHALTDTAGIIRLADDAGLLLSLPSGELDLPALLDLLEQSSQVLAELGALLTTGEDARQMNSALASLDILIAATRDHLRRLDGTALHNE